MRWISLLHDTAPLLVYFEGVKLPLLFARRYLRMMRSARRVACIMIILCSPFGLRARSVALPDCDIDSAKISILPGDEYLTPRMRLSPSNKIPTIEEIRATECLLRDSIAKWNEDQLGSQPQQSQRAA